MQACDVPRIGSGIALVARQQELSALRDALAAASDGRAGAILLAGDAGVGKSRLLAELVAHARADGVRVLTGRCLDVERAGLPYLPFVEALGQLPTSGVSALDDATEQLRLFEAVHDQLTELTADGCVLLALEDLHWADASTRDLVLFLLSRLNQQRLLVVATYRVDDLHRRHPLRPLLAELARLSTVERLDLHPFDRTEAMAFVTALTDGMLPESTARRIAERSEGNAFFCEELTAVSGDLPAGLTELLLSRMERLSRSAQRVVRAASGAGQAVEHSVLQAVTDLDVDDLEEALRESVQHSVLVAADSGYAFRHALAREAVYADLLPGERVRLHAAYARMAASPAELAHHSLRSHDLRTTLTASVEASNEATRLRAPVEALNHVEQALQLWAGIEDAEQLCGTTELSLLRTAYRMAVATGEVDRSIAYGRSAIEQADPLGDPEMSAELRYRLAEALLPLENCGHEVTKVVSQAWQLVRTRPPSPAKARVLALRSRAWVWSWRPDIIIAELHGYAEQAMEMARTVGAIDAELDALVTLAVFAEWEQRIEEARKLGRQAATRASRAGAYDVEIRALINLSVNLLFAGLIRESITVADEVIQRAAEVGLTWHERAIDARTGRLFCLIGLGEWAAALSLDDLSRAPKWVTHRIEAVRLTVLAAQGRFAEVDEISARLAVEADNDRTLEHVWMAQGDAAMWRGRFDEAVDHAGRVLDWLDTLSRSAVVSSRLAGVLIAAALAELADQARRRRDQTELDQVLALAERRVAQVRRHIDAAPQGQRLHEERNPEATGLLARLNAELSRLRGHDDPELWRKAVEDCGELLYWKAQSYWKLAGALLKVGQRDEAATALRHARDIAVHLGATPLLNAVLALGKRGRIALPGVEPDEEDVLTPRERAVLELVAAGLTNKQVGSQLYISEKTASVHLSRVMAKLGAGSRTEAVSLAYDRGLLA